MDINAKYRPFYIAKLLEELTDENHYLTTAQIIQLLEKRYGITTHRQTIPQDIEVLKKIGMDIDCIPSTQNRYRILSRRFDNAELKLLIDAVASSKFISKKKSASLAEWEKKREPVSRLSQICVRKRISHFVVVLYYDSP